MASFNAFIHRLLSFPLSQDNYNIEVSTIKHIAIANGYNSNIVEKLIFKHKNRSSKPETKYVSAIYGNHTPFVLLNNFKKFDYKVSFRTNNKISKLLRNTHNIPLEKKSGIYKLTCDNSESFYIGQTGRKFSARYTEHIPPKNPRVPIIADNMKSNFAKHIIKEKHNCTSLKNNLKPLHICNKGNIMNAFEEFEIYKAFKSESTKILNDQLHFKSNALYNIAININNNNNNNFE